MDWLWLKQRVKGNSFSFAIAVLLLLGVSLQGQISQLYASDAQPTQKEVAAYPATPEGVVEAFVKADFNGIGAGWSGAWSEIQRYTTWLDSPGWDIGNIVADFKITKIRKKSDTADVKVEYKSIGDLSFEDVPIFNEAKTNEVVLYKLIKKNNWWKIESPQLPPHVGVKKVIEHLKLISEEEKNPQNIKKIRQVLRNIDDRLRKLKNQ